MGTRGSWGFVLNGKRWETYNHFDSYPSGLGEDLLSWAREVQDWSVVADRVASLTLVDQDSPCPPLDRRTFVVWEGCFEVRGEYTSRVVGEFPFDALPESLNLLGVE